REHRLRRSGPGRGRGRSGAPGMSAPMPSGPLASDPAAGEGAMHPDPDLSAVSAAQRDSAAFAALYHRYLDAIYSYAFYQLGDHHDAEDATARTFMAALRGI